jgi:hypothetical protein
VCIDWVRGSTLHPHCRVFFVKVTLLSPVSLPGFFFWNIESARRLADQPMIPAQRALGWLAEASVGSILPNVPGLLDLEHSARLEVGDEATPVLTSKRRLAREPRSVGAPLTAGASSWP